MIEMPPIFGDGDVIPFMPPREKTVASSLSGGRSDRLSRRTELRRIHKQDWANLCKKALLNFAEESHQLKDLVDLFGSGKVHHYSGIAIILRKLLGNKPGNRIIRDYCAIEDCELLLSFNYPTKLPIEPSFQLMLTIGSVSDPHLPHITNIEEWLDSQAFKVGDKSYTNSDLIKDIADKVGAHRDYNLSPAIILLNGIKFI